MIPSLRYLKLKLAMDVVPLAKVALAFAVFVAAVIAAVFAAWAFAGIVAEGPARTLVTMGLVVLAVVRL